MLLEDPDNWYVMIDSTISGLTSRQSVAKGARVRLWAAPAAD